MKQRIKEKVKFRELLNELSEATEEEKDETSSLPYGSVVPLDAAPLTLEVSPAITTSPQRCFGQFVCRLPDRISNSTEVSWDKLQSRANAQILGGHTGKLELLWIHKAGV